MSFSHVSDHRQLVHDSLVKLGNGEFFSPSGYQSGSLLRDDRRDEPGLLQQFDSHSVSGIELFPFITRLGIVHARISKDSVHIGPEQTELFKYRAGRPPPY